VIRLRSSKVPARAPAAADKVTVLTVFVPSLATIAAPPIGWPAPSTTVPVMLPSPLTRSSTMSVSESPGCKLITRARLV
jgi:hypothetical protein